MTRRDRFPASGITPAVRPKCGPAGHGGSGRDGAGRTGDDPDATRRHAVQPVGPMRIQRGSATRWPPPAAADRFRARAAAGEAAAGEVSDRDDRSCRSEAPPEALRVGGDDPHERKLAAWSGDPPAATGDLAGPRIRKGLRSARRVRGHPGACSGRAAEVASWGRRRPLVRRAGIRTAPWRRAGADTTLRDHDRPHRPFDFARRRG